MPRKHSTVPQTRNITDECDFIKKRYAIVVLNGEQEETLQVFATEEEADDFYEKLVDLIARNTERMRKNGSASDTYFHWMV